jgi:predicted phage terminase large subunit-like protein
MSTQIKGKITRSEFKQLMADTAAELRRRIEAEVTGLDDSPTAIAARRAKALDAATGYEFFCQTYFPHYLKTPSASSLHRHLFKRIPEIFAAPSGQNDAIAAPRGEAKSTFVSQLAVLWAVARRCKHYVIIGMDAFDQAAVMIEAIKAELEANPRLALDFPEICGQGRVWKEGVIVTKTGVKVEGVGSGKRLRGRRHGPHRPDLFILDDIENDENVKSPDQRDKTEGWVDKAVMNVGAADGSLDIIYVGTILHHDSVLARKLRNPMWRHTRLSSIIDWPVNLALWDRWEEIIRNDGPDTADHFYREHCAEMEEGAKVSWPEVRPLLLLMKLRVKIGRDAFDAEQQNDPLGSEGTLFSTDPVFWVEICHEWVFYGACDPSLGKFNKGRDPSAILVGGKIRDKGILDVIEASIRRRLPSLIIEDIIKFQEQYRCLKWAIESVQFQEFFRTELVAKSAARDIPVPAIPVIPSSDKNLRIESIQPHDRNGLIRYHPSLKALLDERRHFPELIGGHEDGLDCLEMLWSISQGGSMAAGVTVAPTVANRRSSSGTMYGRQSNRMYGRR